MVTLGIKASGDAKEYWLASREVCEDWNASSSYGYVTFNVRYMYTSGSRGSKSLWSVYSVGATATSNPAYAVRPVIKLRYP